MRPSILSMYMVSIRASICSLRTLVTFPPKFYCGIYSRLLNLSSKPEVGFVRVTWKMSRWRKGDGMPMFYVYAEESGARVNTAVA